MDLMEILLKFINMIILKGKFITKINIIISCDIICKEFKNTNLDNQIIYEQLFSKYKFNLNF
jgi:hypothetical protein